VGEGRAEHSPPPPHTTPPPPPHQRLLPTPPPPHPPHPRARPLPPPPILLLPLLVPQVLLTNSKPGSAAAAKSSGVTLGPNPFFEGEDLEPGSEPASVAYRYRRWNLGKDTSVVVRTTVHAVHHKSAGPSYVALYTLNEGDPKVFGAAEWRKTIDTQRGNVLATEMKNNSFKLAKFTVQTLLAGADTMKVGFVSRTVRSNREQHEILGVHTLAPMTFAHQMSMEPSNMWGILKWLIELIRKHAANLRQAEVGEGEGGEGVGEAEFMAKFVVLRDPNDPRLYIYSVPNEAFEGEEEQEEEGDWGEGGEGEGADDGEGEGEGPAGPGAGTGAPGGAGAGGPVGAGGGGGRRA
jgi:translation initiation factor 3 subunit D